MAQQKRANIFNPLLCVLLKTLRRYPILGACCRNKERKKEELGEEWKQQSFSTRIDKEEGDEFPPRIYDARK